MSCRKDNAASIAHSPLLYFQNTTAGVPDLFD